jgi:hypothetical protein
MLIGCMIAMTRTPCGNVDLELRNNHDEVADDDEADDDEAGC